MSTRASIDASATLTDRTGRTLPSEVPCAFPEALRTHSSLNRKAGSRPPGRTAFAEEALSGFFSMDTPNTQSASWARLSSRPDLFEALNDWLNGGKL